MADDTETREQLLRRAYAAFNARDIDAALATMWPDVDWPNGMEGGWVRGHDEIRAYWTRQWGLIDPRVDPIRYAHEGGEVAVDVRQFVRDLAGTVLMDTVVRHVYQIENGLVRRMEIREAGD
ncbi:nuclear transport factor 2 family protein [Zavarzinella formosa]|uniref:nuclear transport factor 2 family protein n=1 Tax=Zavarzinella formosa TaxID=360055 RepID=UPI0002DF718F|nr:nuclear transport factor 2 family protein [Zavarzinella formosa]